MIIKANGLPGALGAEGTSFGGIIAWPNFPKNPPCPLLSTTGFEVGLTTNWSPPFPTRASGWCGLNIKLSSFGGCSGPAGGLGTLVSGDSSPLMCLEFAPSCVSLRLYWSGYPPPLNITDMPTSVNQVMGIPRTSLKRKLRRRRLKKAMMGMPRREMRARDGHVN